jgi:hypothetical protein
MSSKSIIMFGMIVGSTIGGFIPNLWGDSFLSMPSVFLTAVGGICGIWLAYKLTV